MASYTMQLKTIIEQATQYDSLPHRDRIEEGRKKLFDFDYPFFDEEYRKTFETNFIRKFYTREIGFETEGLFKFQLETWLVINMPYFNALFESEKMEYDPLINSETTLGSQKLREVSSKLNRKTNQSAETSGETDGTFKDSSNSTLNDKNFKRDLSSDNPDSRLTITSKDGEGVIEYAKSIDEESENKTSTGNQASSGESKSNTNTETKKAQDDSVEEEKNDDEHFLMRRKGKIGVQSYAKLMMEYRQSLIRIEKTIFDEMQELFMLVY